ncbi:MAG: JAB domain-containing protein, partial [Betaproteobacteria bacterium]|nr:JAB domain-containing protein [Betaproteobacteria bacterium]
RFGTLRGVLDARPDELLSLEGFGPSLGLFWRLLRELMARYEEAPARRREILCTPDAVARMARARLAGCPHEELWIALTDHGNRLIAWERLRRGTVGHVPLLPRDVLEAALLHKASNIILVHNHPGGSAHPSAADLHLTRELARLAPSLDMRLIDHVVVTEDACYSWERDALL